MVDGNTQPWHILKQKMAGSCVISVSLAALSCPFGRLFVEGIHPRPWFSCSRNVVGLFRRIVSKLLIVLHSSRGYQTSLWLCGNTAAAAGFMTSVVHIVDDVT